MWCLNQDIFTYFQLLWNLFNLNSSSHSLKNCGCGLVKMIFLILTSSFLTLYCYQFPFVKSFSNLALCVLLSFHRLKLWLSSFWLWIDFLSITFSTHLYVIYQGQDCQTEIHFTYRLYYFQFFCLQQFLYIHTPPPDLMPTV